MNQRDLVKHFDNNMIGVIARVLPNSDVVVDWENNTRSIERQLNLRIWTEDE